MELSQAIDELKEYVKVDKEHRKINSYDSDFDKFCDNHIESIEKVLREYEVLELQYHLLREETNFQINRLQEENKNLRDLYLRTAKKLDENGKEELADYFLAQIGAVPTLSPQ